MSKIKSVEECASIMTLTAFFSNISYKELYSLAPADFFNQVMIRDRYRAILHDLYCEENKTTFLPFIEMMIQGDVIFDKDIFEKYTPEYIKVNFPSPPRGVKLLSFEKSVSISSNILALVDKGLLTLKEEPKKKDHPDYLAYLPKCDAVFENVNNASFRGLTYENVINGNNYPSQSPTSNILLEVDVKTPEKELIDSFRKIIRTQKELSKEITEPTNIVKSLIRKCQSYRVIEAYDIEMLSPILGVNLTQKEMVKIIYSEITEGWNVDDYQKKTKKQMSDIFKQSFYIQYL